MINMARGPSTSRKVYKHRKPTKCSLKSLTRTLPPAEINQIMSDVFDTARNPASCQGGFVRIILPDKWCSF